MFRIGLIAAALAALMFVVSPALAQYDTQKSWEKKKKNDPPPPTLPPPVVKGGGTPSTAKGGGNCVPSGFARLTRNCSTNTGNCQPMRDSCSLGWCCP